METFKVTKENLAGEPAVNLEKTFDKCGSSVSPEKAINTLPAKSWDNS